MPYFVVGGLYFAGKVDFGTFGQVSFAFSMVLRARPAKTVWGLGFKVAPLLFWGSCVMSCVMCQLRLGHHHREPNSGVVSCKLHPAVSHALQELES